MGQFHYQDGKGNTLVEDLDAEESNIDERVLVEFGSLEQDISKKTAVAPTDQRLKSVQELIEFLPPNRADHWRKELDRVGLVKYAKKAAAPAAAPAAAAATTGTSTTAR